MFIETNWRHFCIEDDNLLPKGIKVMVCESRDNNHLDSINLKCNDSDFIEKYHKMYYGEGDALPGKLNISNEFVEKQIMSILDKSVWSKKDIFQILAWKTGNIKCKESDEKQVIQYSDNWKYDKHDDNGDFVIQLFRQKATQSYVFSEFADNVKNIKKYYEEHKGEDANRAGNEAWKKLVEANTVTGLGTVYLITIFSFLTHGEWPIYDRFAMASLVAFELHKQNVIIPINNASKDVIIQLNSLPGKDNKKKVSGLIEEPNSIYNKYIACLNSYFNKEWKVNRKIDEALWVYGHYFDVIVG